MKYMTREMRVPNRQTTTGWGGTDRGSVVLSTRHGYLWIGFDKGPFVMTISGKTTLRRLARMLLAHAK